MGKGDDGDDSGSLRALLLLDDMLLAGRDVNDADLVVKNAWAAPRLGSAPPILLDRLCIIIIDSDVCLARDVV